jgi:hypothetical protein
MQRHQQILMRQRGAVQRALRRCQLLALAFPENDEIMEDVVILSSVIALLEDLHDVRIPTSSTKH